MGVKRVTFMVLDDNNKSARAVFNADGECTQGDAAKVMRMMRDWSPKEPTPPVDEAFDKSDVETSAAADTPATTVPPADGE